LFPPPKQQLDLSSLTGGAVMTEQAGDLEEKSVGTVTHYFGHIGVMAVELTEGLAVGATVHVKGHTTDLVLKVDSMQIEHEAVVAAKAGDSVGIRVTEKVRPGDHVYRAA
jgi:translation elongation factor EF-1alpha